MYKSKYFKINESMSYTDDRIKGFVTDIDLVSSLYKKTCDEVDEKNKIIDELHNV